MGDSFSQYDIVIIGAGPSGTLTGIAYKNLNPDLRVAIVDMQTFPRDKSCGDAIGPGVINALKRFGLDDILYDQEPVISTSLSGTGEVEINNYIPEVKNKDDSIVYVIPRKELDHKLLVKALELGVEDFTGYRYLGMESTKEGWSIELSKNEKILRLNSKLIVGADGANSRVRKSLGVKSNDDKDKALAIRAYIDSPNFVSHFNERSLFFEINLSAERGYAWAFPSNRDLVNVGIGIPVNIFKKENLDINSLLEIFIERLRSKGIVVNNVRDARSYVLPFASSLPKFSHNHAALVGDAASMINPMSGEGIFYGMEAGYILAKHTHDKLSSKKLNESIGLYEKEFRKRFGRHYLSCTIARRVLEVPFMTKRLLNVAKYNQHTIDFIIELLFDEAHLTLKELFLLTGKFLLPINLLKIGSKNTSST